MVEENTDAKKMTDETPEQRQARYNEEQAKLVKEAEESGDEGK